MNKDVIRYHYFIRIVAIIIIVALIKFSKYQQNMYMVVEFAALYMIYNTIAFFCFKFKKYHIMNLFFDVFMLSVIITSRGGLRSDFYLGYFLILGYVLLIKKQNLLLKLSSWIVLNYSVAILLFSEDASLSFGRLLIRIVLIIGISLLLQNYSKMLFEAESLKEKAVHMAMFDSLTGAYNRRILEHLGELYELENIALYAVLLDIDDFKAINDQYGHAKGDEILIALVAEIQKSIDDDSVCIRYGGEEFLILFQTNNYNDVKNTINKIQQSIRDKKFTWLKPEDVIAFTAGVSFRVEKESIEETIERADTALYHGKENGKNCIILNENKLGSQGRINGS